MIYLFFTYFGYLVLIINLILYSKGFFKFGKAFKIFTAYLLFTLIIEGIMEVLTLLSIHNLYLIHVYFIGQLILLGFFYKELLKTSSLKKTINFLIVFGLIVIGIQYCFTPQLFFTFNLFEITLTSILVVLFAITYLYNMLTEKKEFYYVTISSIVYLLTSTILFLVGNLTIGLSDEIKLITWNLNAFLVLMYQLFILLEWKVSFSKKEFIR